MSCTEYGLTGRSPSPCLNKGTIANFFSQALSIRSACNGEPPFPTARLNTGKWRCFSFNALSLRLSREREPGFWTAIMEILAVILLVVSVTFMPSSVRCAFSWILFATFVASVGTTWYRLYQGEVFKRNEAACSRLPKHSEVWSFKQEECIEYYEHLTIFMEALPAAVIQTGRNALRAVATDFNRFLQALLKDVPVQSQTNSLYTLLTVLVIMFFGFKYRVSVPFLLTVEPTPPSR